LRKRDKNLNIIHQNSYGQSTRMTKLISKLKTLGIVIAVLFLSYSLANLLGFMDTVRPLYQLFQLGSSQKVLRVDKLCSNLLKGDYIAASKPIARKTAKRKFSLANTILWLAKREKSPFIHIPKSPLFTDLPSDQGALQSCKSSRSVSLVRNKLSKDIYLGYPKSRLTVSLQYSTGFFSPTLQFIKIGKIEQLSPNLSPPGETTRRVSEFIEKLNQIENKPNSKR